MMIEDINLSSKGKRKEECQVTPRDTIINTYRDRIRSNQRTHLSSENLNILVHSFVELLQGADTEKKIKMLCEAEIKLLEEGYPQASVAKYITRYRKAIATAIEDGSLKLASRSGPLQSLVHPSTTGHRKSESQISAKALI